MSTHGAGSSSNDYWRERGILWIECSSVRCFNAGLKGSLSGLMCMIIMWNLYYSLHSHLISTQLNTYSMGDVVCFKMALFTTIIKTQTEGTYFGRKIFISLVELQRLGGFKISFFTPIQWRWVNFTLRCSQHLKITIEKLKRSLTFQEQWPFTVLWTIHRPHCQHCSLQLLSTEEKVPLKTEICWLSCVSGTLFLERSFTVGVSSCNFAIL